MLDVAGPAGGRVLVRMRRERRCAEGFDELALRARLDAHAALLAHHVALFVELTYINTKCTKCSIRKKWTNSFIYY
jgi:hypothetical protein